MCSTGYYWCAKQESIMGAPWESNGVFNGKLLVSLSGKLSCAQLEIIDMLKGKLLCAQLDIIGVLNGKLDAQWEVMCSTGNHW